MAKADSCLKSSVVVGSACELRQTWQLMRLELSLSLFFFISSATLSIHINEDDTDDWMRGFAMCRCEGYTLGKNKKEQKEHLDYIKAAQHTHSSSSLHYQRVYMLQSKSTD